MLVSAALRGGETPCKHEQFLPIPPTMDGNSPLKKTKLKITLNVSLQTMISLRETFNLSEEEADSIQSRDLYSYSMSNRPRIVCRFT